MSAAYIWRDKVSEKTLGKNSVGSSGENGTKFNMSNG